jgi:hypothetical protein
MKNGGKMLFCVAGTVALVMAARAAKLPGDVTDRPADKPADTLNPDNPYGAIVERNVFDLHDPPPPKLEPDTPKGPPPNIKLNGITTIFGMKQALISLTKPGAAGKPPTTIFLTLSEGQRKDDVEVLEINPKARTTKIKNEDVESLLNIETNRAVAGGPAPGGGAPGAHAPASTPPGFPQPQNPYGGNRTAIPPRPTRTDYQQPNATPAYNSAQNNAGYNGAGGIQTPGGVLNPYGGAATQTGAPSQQPQLSPLEQYTLMEAQRAQAQAGQTDPGIAAIMPQTPLGSALNPQPNEAPGNDGPPGPPSPAPQAPGVRTSGSLGGIYVPGR